MITLDRCNFPFSGDVLLAHKNTIQLDNYESLQCGSYTCQNIQTSHVLRLTLHMQISIISLIKRLKLSQKNLVKIATDLIFILKRFIQHPGYVFLLQLFGGMPSCFNVTIVCWILQINSFIVFVSKENCSSLNFIKDFLKFPLNTTINQ